MSEQAEEGDREAVQVMIMMIVMMMIIMMFSESESVAVQNQRFKEDIQRLEAEHR